MSIRPATPEDAANAAPLMFNVFQELAYILTGEASQEKATAILAQFFQADGNRLSYHNTLVKEVAGQIAGLIIAYHGRDIPRLDQPIVERVRRLSNDSTFTLDKEAEEDEFYIDTLSVAPAYEGRGYGTELMRAIEQWAQSLHYHKLSLNVFPENKRASGLYTRLGYTTVYDLPIAGHPYYHMVKQLA